jgi:hypothetical protein
MAGVTAVPQAAQEVGKWLTTLSGSATCRRVSPLWPFWPPGFLPDGSRELLVRGGFFSPSLEGGLPLFPLFSPSRRSRAVQRSL